MSITEVEHYVTGNVAPERHVKVGIMLNGTLGEVEVTLMKTTW